jgi:hypothetical protein
MGKMFFLVNLTCSIYNIVPYRNNSNIEHTSTSSSTYSKSQPKQRKRQKKNSFSHYKTSADSNIDEASGDQITTKNSIPLNDISNSNPASRPKRKRRI